MADGSGGCVPFGIAVFCIDAAGFAEAAGRGDSRQSGFIHIVGIGLFITFIGLRNMGIVVKNEETLVSAGPLSWTVVMGLIGLLVMAFLEIKRIKGALLIGIMSSTHSGSYLWSCPKAG